MFLLAFIYVPPCFHICSPCFHICSSLIFEKMCDSMMVTVLVTQTVKHKKKRTPPGVRALSRGKTKIVRSVVYLPGLPCGCPGSLLSVIYHLSHLASSSLVGSSSGVNLRQFQPILDNVSSRKDTLGGTLLLGRCIVWGFVYSYLDFVYCV